MGVELDPGFKALSRAMRLAFVVLTIIMVVLVVFFLISGFETVKSDEKALVLRFGKIHGVGEDRILEPRPWPYWVFPEPIEEIIKIPVGKKIDLDIDSFWYFQTKEDTLPESLRSKSRPGPKLNPIRDGYCITRGEKQSQDITGSGSDYSIVHSKWRLTYQIYNPESFFRNVYVEDIKPGQVYFNVITESIAPLLKSLVESSVVTAMVNYTIDEAISSKYTIPEHVKKLLQEKLDKIDSGITAESVQLVRSTWPRQVDSAFQRSIQASNQKKQLITEAETYAEGTLNEAAGPVAKRLMTALEDETVGAEQREEFLWSQLAGAAQQKIAQARAYRTKVVETARANADYLQQLLPEYRKRPEIVIQEIYRGAMEYILNNADEKIIIQPTEGTKGREIRIQLNRDPTIKQKSVKD